MRASVGSVIPASLIAHDVLALAHQIQCGVAEAFGVELTPEPVLLGF